MNLSAQYPALYRRIFPPKLQVAPRPDRTAVTLGRRDDTSPLCLPLRARLEHLFILGATGAGKSSLLLHYFAQLVRLQEGGLLLDPHGSLATDLLCALRNLDHPIHLIDLAAGNIVGFNPLETPAGTDPSVIVGSLMDALSIVWEGESFSQKPSIERVMSAVLTACAELSLTIPDAEHMLERKDPKGLRQYAIAHVRDDHTRRELQRLDDLSRERRRDRDFDNEIVGPLNRLARLLRPPIVRAILSQPKSTIDFKGVMDGGEVVIASLAGMHKAYERDADLFGRVLIRSVFFHATRRETRTPFTLVMDEAGRYLSNDIPLLLAEVRKYSVSVVAAMQWLEQA